MMSLTYGILLPFALATACLLVWLEILAIILVRHFRDVSQAKRLNVKVFVLEMLNLVVILPNQFILCLHGHLLWPIWQVAALALTVNGLITGGLLVCWVVTILLPKHQPSLDQLQAVVVLGAGLHDGQVPPILASRLDTASQLWHRHPTAYIVVSGAQLRGDYRSEAAAMASYLTECCHIPQAQILLEEGARNTWQNLRLSASLLSKKGISGQVVIVTSSFHVPRTWLYRRRQQLSWRLVAAPTPFSHQPMAVTRDFLGIVRDHRWLAVLIVIIAMVLIEIATNKISF